MRKRDKCEMVIVSVAATILAIYAISALLV
jgi:hypothetical protein